MLVGKVNGKIEALGIFGVGGNNGGEIAVDHHLLGDADEMLDAELRQRLRHELVAAAVERRIDKREIVRDLFDGLVIVDHAHDVCHEFLIAVRANERDEPGGDRLVIVHGPHAGEDVDFGELRCDRGGVLRRQLRAVGPVDLVAVVFLRIVAGGDIDARLTAVFAHGEGKLRRGAQSFKQVDLHSVCRHDAGGGAGKLLRVVAAVHADGDAARFRLRALGADHIGEALRCPADDVPVHIVQPDIHCAAQSRRAEFQRTVKAAFDLLFVVCDGQKLRVLLRAQRGRGEPSFVFLTVVHFISSSSTGLSRFCASSSMDAGT